MTSLTQHVIRGNWFILALRSEGYDVVYTMSSRSTTISKHDDYGSGPLVVLHLLAVTMDKINSLHPRVLPHQMRIKVLMIPLILLNQLLLIHLMITHYLMFLLREYTNHLLLHLIVQLLISMLTIHHLLL